MQPLSPGTIADTNFFARNRSIPTQFGRGAIPFEFSSESIRCGFTLVFFFFFFFFLICIRIKFFLFSELIGGLFSARENENYRVLISLPLDLITYARAYEEFPFVAN